MVRKMRNVHPGEILKMELIDGRKFSISKIAELLDTPISGISNVLNGNAGVSPMIALKLEKVFGGRADSFLRLQTGYALEEFKKQFKP